MSEWMQSVTVEVKTVTPLFLGGADPRGQPELRPPAFRGAMRYWYRAVLGGVIGDRDLKSLRKLEQEVFGDTECGSPFSIQIQQVPLKTERKPILPHKTPSGIRMAFSEGQQFRVILRTSRPVDPLVWVNVCMAFNLAVGLGGLGLRSRRGAGSLQVIGSSDPSLIPIFPTKTEEIRKYIERILRSALKQAKSLAEQKGVSSSSALPLPPTQFPCAAKGAEIRLVKEWAVSPQEALAKLMRKMPKIVALGGSSPRQGSPLWAHLFYTPNQYHLLLTLLPSRLAHEKQNYNEVAKVLQSFGGETIEIKGWNV